MTDYAWPTDLPPQTMVWEIQKSGVQFRSPYAGSVESVSFPGWFWRISLTLKPRRSKGSSAGDVEGWFNGAAGADIGLLVYHWLRPVPRGTMRGSPIVASSVARGATSIPITTTGDLKRGDLFKIDNVVYQCFFDCSPVSGTLTVPIVAQVRAAIAAAAPVTWDRPTVRCTMPSFSNASAYRPGVMEGTPIDLEEAP